MTNYTFTGTIVPVAVLLGMTEMRGGKIKSGKRSRPSIQDRDGMQWWRDGERPVQKRQVIDRANDWYFEEVVDLTTGHVIRFCDEPLSLHRTRRERS